MQAPSGLQSDVIIELPAEDVEKSSGLSIDIGSTIGKLVYRSNKEYKDGKPIKYQADPTKGQVHFAMFPRYDLDGMIKYLKENADVTPNQDGVIVVNSSGVGGIVFQKDIEKGLNCKMELIPETDCFGQAFLALEKMKTNEELFVFPSAKVQAMVDQKAAQVKETFDKMVGQMNMKIGGISTNIANAEDRPRLLIIAGSTTSIMQINKDETLTLVFGIHTAGKTMYGLAAYLTGENDFNKLLTMAEASDGKSADIWSSDLMPKKPEGEEENMYTLRKEAVQLFPLGKGVTSSLAETKKGDLAFSAFNMIAQVHSHAILQCCCLTGATEAYLCGNLFNSEFMRERVLMNKSIKEAMYALEHPITFHFIKDGGSLGALGAMLLKKKPKGSKPAK